MKRAGADVIESAVEAGAAGEIDMAVDAVLWLILAAMVGLICCGCVFTARAKKPRDRGDKKFAHGERNIDRAA